MNAEQVYSTNFDRMFFALPPATRRQIEARIDELGADLRGFRHHQLTGSRWFRLRAGDYRIIYRFDAARNELFLLEVGHRREIYR
ncbi:MAG: type II toxin-antitoxin system RelE/ParE family toxin [Verrucomicrobia bacterium]|nr:type II toxin-antitoxin system RelE/ParE family toxin [Verrucomicrobiota bacterium]